MSYTYTTFVAAYAATLEYDSASPIFQSMLPSAIEYAERRIYGDIDQLVQNKTDSSAASANTRDFALPTSLGNFRVVKAVNVITPAGTAAASGARNPVTVASRDVIDTLWPSATANTGLPQLYAMKDNQTITLGPSPDAAYVIEVVGTIQPTALSADNPTTYLTTVYPALFFAAAMVFGKGFQGNFGAMSDDPKAALSWDNEYQKLLASASAEEKRRRGDS